MNHKRTIAVVTSSRADYGHLYWPLKHLAAAEQCDLRLIAFAAHLMSSQTKAQTLPVINRTRTREDRDKAQA